MNWAEAASSLYILCRSLLILDAHNAGDRSEPEACIHKHNEGRGHADPTVTYFVGSPFFNYSSSEWTNLAESQVWEQKKYREKEMVGAKKRKPVLWEVSLLIGGPGRRKNRMAYAGAGMAWWLAETILLLNSNNSLQNSGWNSNANFKQLLNVFGGLPLIVVSRVTFIIWL